MRKESKHHNQCEKFNLTKCNGICVSYNELQTKFAKRLEEDETVVSFECNVPIEDEKLADGVYTTDFVIHTANGDIAVRECVFRKNIMKMKTAKLLDVSREHWLVKGVKDWGIVIDAKQ